jgi:hypothetical protein
MTLFSSLGGPVSVVSVLMSSPSSRRATRSMFRLTLYRRALPRKRPV